MPRPLSTTRTRFPGRSATSISFAKPPIASSRELSNTSQIRWWSPSGPVVPIYMPGRLRTGSSPSSTVMSSARYEPDALASRELPFFLFSSVLSAIPACYIDCSKFRLLPRFAYRGKHNNRQHEYEKPNGIEKLLLFVVHTERKSASRGPFRTRQVYQKTPLITMFFCFSLKFSVENVG